jgi:hypothetical protein
MRIFFCLFFITYTSLSQQWLGVSTSNYAGTYNLAANPANISDSRYKLFLNLGGGNIDVINNYVGWAAPYSFFGLSTNSVPKQYRTSNGLAIFRLSYIDEARDKPNSVAFLAADVKGPSLFYTFEKSKIAIGLTSRGRMLTNLSYTTSDLAHIMVKGTFIPDLYGKTQANNHLVMNLNGYTETGLTLGAVINEQDQDFFKVGLTVKRLNGLINIHYLVDNLDFTVDANSANALRQDVYFRNAIGTYGTTTSDAINSFSFSPNWLFGNLAAGKGYGFDIGAVYEFRPEFDKYEMKVKGKRLKDGTKNKYLYRIGVALIDVGSINYSKPAFANVIQITKTNVQIQPGTFNKIDSPDRLYYQMNNAFSISQSDYQHGFVVALPMALSSSFDYKISEKIYMNATWIQSLRNSKKMGMNQPSMLAIIPRYESKWLDIAVPISLQNGYRNLTFGLSVRVGSFFLGSENLAGIVNIGNPKGISAYAGLFLPIFRKLPDTPNGCYTEEKISLRQEIRDFLNKRSQRRGWNRIR